MGDYFSFSLNKKFVCEEKPELADIYLVSYSSDRKLIELVVECFNRSQAKESTKIVLSNSLKQDTIKRKFSPFENLYEEVMNFKYSRKKAYKLIKTTQDFSNITARLLESYLYYISGNSARAEILLEEIPNRDLKEYSFNSDIRNIPYKTQKKQILKLLIRFKKESYHSQVFENLLYYLAYGSSGIFSNEIIQEFKLNQNMSYIRKKYRSKVYGLPYPFVWSLPIMRFASRAEYSKYIGKSNLASQFKFQPITSLLVLSTLDSIERPYREPVLKLLNKLIKKKDFYSQEVFFNLIGNEVLFNFFSSHQKLKLGLLVNKKRKIYSSALKQKRFYEYGQFKLISIGDIKEHDIIKLLRFKGY